MAKTIASNSKPAAWIVSPNDRGRKSIKNGNVFLNDGDEFEIELFNPLTVSVLADIKLNGQSISKTGLVIRPGQRAYIDCFIDDKKKFVFKTYEIENSGEALDATQNNGLLEVFFYKEDVITLDNWRSKFDKVIVEKWYPVYYPYQRPYIYINGYPSTCTVTNLCGSGTTTTSGVYYASSNIGGITSANSTYTSSVDLSNLKLNNGSNLIKCSNSIETGRVEKGSKSKQKFTEVDMDFENNYISSTIIRILPESRKPVDVNNVKKDHKENDLIELIKKLSDLHDAGILTDDEFSDKKAELLSKI